MLATEKPIEKKLSPTLQAGLGLLLILSVFNRRYYIVMKIPANQISHTQNYNVRRAVFFNGVNRAYRTYAGLECLYICSV